MDLPASYGSRRSWGGGTRTRNTMLLQAPGPEGSVGRWHAPPAKTGDEAGEASHLGRQAILLQLAGRRFTAGRLSASTNEPSDSHSTNEPSDSLTGSPHTIISLLFDRWEGSVLGHSPHWTGVSGDLPAVRDWSGGGGVLMSPPLDREVEQQYVALAPHWPRGGRRARTPPIG